MEIRTIQNVIKYISKSKDTYDKKSDIAIQIVRKLRFYEKSIGCKSKFICERMSDKRIEKTRESEALKINRNYTDDIYRKWGQINPATEEPVCKERYRKFDR